MEHLLRGEVRRCEAECGAARRRRALSTDTAPAAVAAVAAVSQGALVAHPAVLASLAAWVASLAVAVACQAALEASQVEGVGAARIPKLHLPTS